MQQGSAPDLDAGGEPSCVPKGCDERGFECGMAEDGCGGVVDCSGIKTCKGFDICGAVEPNQCGCERRTCESVAVQSGRQACGTLEVGCGEDAVACGDSCPAGQSCGAVEPNVCGCVPDLSACSDKQCGSIPDGCGGEVSCGICPAGGICNGQQQCICNGVPCETETEDLCPGCDAATRAMVGSYLIRNVSFAVSNVGLGDTQGRNESISLVEIRLDANRQLVLTEKPCTVDTYEKTVQGENLSGLIPRAGVEKLQLPERVVEVDPQRNEWRIPSAKNTIGWRRHVPYCQPGSTVPDSSNPSYASQVKHTGAEKPWLGSGGGVCTCVESSALPASLNDCRIVDDDEDGRPGITFEVGGDEAYLVSVTDVDMWGSIDLQGRKHRGTSLDGPDSSQAAVRCEGIFVNLVCGSIGDDTRFCPDEYNTVDFLPLETLRRSLGKSELHCADVLDNSGNRAAIGLSGASGIEQTRGRTYPSAAVCR